MNTSPLFEQQQILGAIFHQSGDWNVPLHFGNSHSEYEALHHTAGLADLSPRGRVIVSGEDRITWLQSIISQDILPLQVGEGRYSAFMDHKGKMLSYFRVFIRPDTVLIEDVGEVGEQTFQALRKFLLYGTKAKMAKASDTEGLLLICGPQSTKILRGAFDIDVSALSPLGSASLTYDGSQCFVARTDETGGDDFELFVPKESLPSLWTHLLNIGNPLGLQPIGTAAREIARIEAGLPRLGLDINERIVPPEANLEGVAFSLTKGCYPGQEVVARMDTYGSVKRRLVGLVVEGTENDLPEAGAKLFSGTREVGWASSSTFSRLLQKPIALGFPLRDFTNPDTQLEVETQNRRVPARVSPLPFTA